MYMSNDAQHQRGRSKVRTAPYWEFGELYQEGWHGDKSRFNSAVVIDEPMCYFFFSLFTFILLLLLSKTGTLFKQDSLGSGCS